MFKSRFPKKRVSAKEARQKMKKRKQGHWWTHLRSRPNPRVRFLPKIKGEVFFRFPHATPVSSTIEERGKRAPFTMVNVEWISKRHQIVQTKLSRIWTGRIKFRGKRSPVACIIKEITYSKEIHSPQILGGWKECDKGEIISRLNSSKASYPKMAHLIIGKKEYVIQEAFLLKQIESKLYSKNDFFTTLRPEFPNHRELLRQMIEQTARLAEGGLAYGLSISHFGKKMIDVFNAVRKKDGTHKVLVQDIDALFVEPDKQRAWEMSTHNLLSALGGGVLHTSAKNAQAIGEELIKEVGEKHGLKTHHLA